LTQLVTVLSGLVIKSKCNFQQVSTCSETEMKAWFGMSLYMQNNLKQCIA
jgi:hypothetical protein